ncbi:hypothetical protein ABI59_06295 [Acidobacteria bacterium Mor1]|nr:hypothetical protein ABI59_06295 [Acidobacteria bacterium Mor1]
MLPCCLALLFAVVPVQAADPEIKSEDDRLMYVLGQLFAKNVAQFEISESELALIQLGFADGALGRDERVDVAGFAPKIQGMLQARVAAAATKEKAAGDAWVVEQAAKESGSVTSESGAVYRQVSAGDGASPALTDKVKVRYHGTLRDGTVFDSNMEPNEDGTAKDPLELTLQQFVPCFRDGVGKMKVGGKAVLTCPSDTAYGDRGFPPTIKPGAAIRFEVELVEVVKPEAPATPTP